MAKHTRPTTRLGDVVGRFTEIERLQSEVKDHIEAINEIYGRLQAVAGNGIRATQAWTGRIAVGGKRGPKGKRAKRGALKAAIYKVLSGGKTLRPADVVRALPGVGFRSGSTPKVLYTTVYLSLAKDKNVQKTGDGFKLKASAKT